MRYGYRQVKADVDALAVEELLPPYRKGFTTEISALLSSFHRPESQRTNILSTTASVSAVTIRQ